jgi:hypothetical protein
MDFQTYAVKSGFVAIARKLEKDEYFQNVLGHAGDYIVTINKQEYIVRQELFEFFFQRQYSCLDEFIEDKRKDNSSEVVDLTVEVLREITNGE